MSNHAQPCAVRCTCGRPLPDLRADPDPAHNNHVSAARRIYASDEIEIDDNPTTDAGADDGVWVHARLWVQDAEATGQP